MCQFGNNNSDVSSGVTIMNSTSGLNLGGSLKVCSFTQNLDILRRRGRKRYRGIEV